MELQQRIFQNGYQQNSQISFNNPNSYQDPYYQKFFIHWQAEIQRLGTIPSMMCCKPIKKDELLWKCYDCSNDQENLCLCTDCFKKGDHRGHRVFFEHKDSSEATCDCGDKTLPYQMYCGDHQKGEGYNSTDLEDMIDKQFAQDLFQIVNSKLVKIFTVIDKNWDSSFQIQSVKSEMDGFIEFIQTLTEKNTPIMHLLGTVLTQKIQQFNTHHKCEQIEEVESNWVTSSDQNRLCTCTLQENLFKYRIYFDKLGKVNQIEQELSDIFKLLMINDEYKKHLLQSYIKLYNYISFNSTELSGFWSLYVQFFSNRSMQEVMSNPQFYLYFQNHFSKVIQSIHYDYQPNTTTEHWKQLYEFGNYLFEHPIVSQLWEENIQNMNLCVAYMESIGESVNHFYISNEQELTQINIDAYNMDLFSTIIMKIRKIKNEQKKIDILKYLIFRAYKIYQNQLIHYTPPIPNLTKSNSYLQPHGGDSLIMEEEIPSEENSNGTNSTHCSNNTNNSSQSLQNNSKDFRYWFINGARMFGILVFNLIDILGRKKASLELQSVFNYYNISQNFREEALKNIVKTITKSIQFMKSLDQSFESCRGDYTFQKELVLKYKSNTLLSYDRDVLSLQSLVQVMEPTHFVQSLVTEFDIDIQMVDNYSNLTGDQRKSLIRFLDILVIMQLDTTPYINIQTIQKNTKNSDYQTLLQNTIVYTFTWTKKIDYTQLTKCLNMIGLTLDLDLEKALQTVTDEQDGLYTLKQEYADKYIHEPYCFIRFCSNMQEAYCKLRQFAEQHDKYDINLGNGEFELKNIDFFKNLTPRLFVGPQIMYSICIQVLLQDPSKLKLDQIFPYIVRFSLKITYLGLFRAYKCGLILNILEKNFGKDMRNGRGLLYALQREPDFINTIPRLFKRICELQKMYQNTKGMDIEKGCCLHVCENEENQAKISKEEKKKKMFLRQMEIKNKLQKKAQNFSLRFEEQLQCCGSVEIPALQCSRIDAEDSIKPSCTQCKDMDGKQIEEMIEQVKRDIKCQKILLYLKCEILSIPAFIGSDNLRNYYYGNTQLQQGSRQFTMVTCNHYVHQMCDHQGWKKLNNIPLKSLTQDKNKQQFETLCRVCNGVKNIYISIFEYQMIPKLFFDELKLMEQDEIYQFQKQENNNMIYDILFKYNTQQQIQQFSQNDVNYTVNNHETLLYDTWHFLMNLAHSVNKDFNQPDISWAIFVYKDLFEFMIEQIFLLGFKVFMGKGKGTVLKNQILQFRLLILSSQDMINQYGKNVGYTQQLQNYYLNNVTQLIDVVSNKFVLNVTQKVQNNRYDLDLEYNSFVSNLLIFMANKPDEDLYKVLKLFSETYLNNLNILFVYIMVVFSDPENNYSLYDCHGNINVSNIKNKISMKQIKRELQCDMFFECFLGYIFPYYRLVMGTFWNLFFNDYAFEAKMQPELRSELVKHEMFLGDIFFRKEKIIEEAPKFLDQLNENCNINWTKFLCKNPCQKFQIKKIEKQNFQEFHKDNFFNMCNLCNDFPKVPHQSLYKCLICQTQLCSQKCNPQDKFSSNLFRHAHQCHQGRTIYIELQTGQVYLMDEEKCILHKHKLFFNALGQSFQNEVEVDWKQYSANQCILANLNQILLERRINWEIRQRLSDKITDTEFYSLIQFEDGDSRYGPI